MKTRPLTWIAKERVISLIQWEPLLVLLILALATWGFYKLLLRDVSGERHRLLRRHFRNLSGHLIVGLSLFGLTKVILWTGQPKSWLHTISSYVGFLAIVSGCTVFIKTLRIMAFEYLFLGSMRAGVPRLLVNIFTLIASLITLGWVLTTFFNVQLTPLLATSAVLSIVLGLALQDTLGNLFSAIGLQLDKPFELGDWIELKNGTERIAAGQVQEVSWRATVLLAVTDELITIPNRYLAQWQISNFSGRERPFIRSHLFRVPFDTPIESVKKVLIETSLAIREILTDPAPVVIVTETTDSWITLKAIYYISDYGSQFGIADRFLQLALSNLKNSGIRLASPRISIEKPALGSTTDHRAM